jgi:hypothetical protein
MRETVVDLGTYLDTMLLVRDMVGGDRRMMANLLGDKYSLASIVMPRSQEQLAQKGVQGLLFAS